MSIASRHGKLNAVTGDDDGWHRRVEDLLTADVFGAYRYLPPRAGLIPFLFGAVDADGTTLESWADARNVTCTELAHARLLFWPRLSGREPDLLVALGRSADEVNLLVLVEAKLHSDQHWIEGRSQLGFYGELLFDEDAVVELFEDLELPAHRPLVFLTKGADAPTAALILARKELSDRVADGETDVFWTSWHRAREVAAASLAEAGQPLHMRSLLSDLLEDLAERGFGPPRPRVGWPVPPLRRLEDAQTEAWLRPPPGPATPGPTIRQLERSALAQIDAFLRDWSLR